MGPFASPFASEDVKNIMLYMFILLSKNSRKEWWSQDFEVKGINKTVGYKKRSERGGREEPFVNRRHRHKEVYAKFVYIDNPMVGHVFWEVPKI